MQIPTHILSGWCIAASLPLKPRERLGCMFASSLADLDGISLAWGWQVYTRWHHVIGHNVFAGLLLGFLVSRMAEPGRRGMLFGLGLLLFSLHLLMDYWGSGHGWGVSFLWPVDPHYWVNPHAWRFSGWQNYSILAGLTLWTLALAWWRRLTPLELTLPRAEAAFRRWRGQPAVHLLG